MSVFSYERVIAPTCRKYNPIITIIETGENDTSFAKLFLQASKRIDIYFAANFESLDVIEYVFQVSDCGSGFIKYVSTFENGFKLLECFRGCISEVKTLQVFDTGCGNAYMWRSELGFDLLPRPLLNIEFAQSVRDLLTYPMEL